VTDFEFSTWKVNKQGSVYMDPREVELDTSQAFEDFRDFLANEILTGTGSRNNRFPELIDGIWFRQLELKLVPGLMFLGAEFNDLMIGRPQNWSSVRDMTFKQEPQGKIGAPQ
jgi:hypothetical protein